MARGTAPNPAKSAHIQHQTVIQEVHHHHHHHHHPPPVPAVPILHKRSSESNGSDRCDRCDSIRDTGNRRRGSQPQTHAHNQNRTPINTTIEHHTNKHITYIVYFFFTPLPVIAVAMPSSQSLQQNIPTSAPAYSRTDRSAWGTHPHTHIYTDQLYLCPVPSTGTQLS